MKTIKEQIDIFCEESGCSCYRLAKETMNAGVTETLLSRIRTGKQPDITLTKAVAIYSAMRRINPSAAEKALAEDE